MATATKKTVEKAITKPANAKSKSKAKSTAEDLLDELLDSGPAGSATVAPTQAPVNAATLKAAYDDGVLARQNRNLLDSAPGETDDPLNLEWRRGWMIQRTGECQTDRLLEGLEDAGFAVGPENVNGLESLNEGQRIQILDWLDTAPAEGDPELWTAFDARCPEFATITGDVELDGDVEFKVIKFAGTGAGTAETEESDAQSAGADATSAADATGDAAGDAASPGSSDALAPTAAASAVPATNDLQREFAITCSSLAEIKEINGRFRKLNSRVAECESAVKAAKGRLSEAQEERDKVGRELSDIIADANDGQGRLPFDVGLKAPIAPAGVPSPATATSPSAPVVSTPTPAAPQIIPLSVLLAKDIKAIVGRDAFEAAKNSDDPIGLSEKQIEKLEAAEISTLNELEKQMRDDELWHQKIQGFGLKGIDRLISTLAAYRKVNPMVSEGA